MRTTAMSELDPDVRGVIRRRIEVRESHGHERLLLNHEALRALLDAADERDRLRTWQERVALAAGIGDEVEGRGVHLEADPDVAAEVVAGMLAVVDTHDECPIHCDRCGETLADVWCGRCHGSGCGPGTATGAYEECEWCAGAGKVHIGCADLCYAALVSERDRLAAAAERVRALAEDWRYKGEFGWGAWQEGHGPDESGLALDDAACKILRALDNMPSGNSALGVKP